MNLNEEKLIVTQLGQEVWEIYSMYLSLFDEFEPEETRAKTCSNGTALTQLINNIHIKKCGKIEECLGYDINEIFNALEQCISLVHTTLETPVQFIDPEFLS